MNPRIVDLLLRGLLLVAAYYNFLGFMWVGGTSGTAPYVVYMASPWIAMAVGAFLPSRMLRRNSGKLLFGPIALLAVARIAHQIMGDLTLTYGPDYGPALIRLGFIALLVFVAAKAFMSERHSPPSVSQHQP